MATFLNFDKFEVSGASKEEAFINLPFEIDGDATVMYRRFMEEHKDEMNEELEMQFFYDYLAHKSKNAPGVGYFVRIEPAIKNTRERPYHVERITNSGGRKLGRVYQLIDADTNQILANCDKSKSDAEALAKKLILDGFKGNIKCLITKQVIEGEPVAFTASYAKSSRAQDGTWIVFGIRKI